MCFEMFWEWNSVNCTTNTFWHAHKAMINILLNSQSVVAKPCASWSTILPSVNFPRPATLLSNMTSIIIHRWCHTHTMCYAETQIFREMCENLRIRIRRSHNMLWQHNNFCDDYKFTGSCKHQSIASYMVIIFFFFPVKFLKILLFWAASKPSTNNKNMRTSIIITPAVWMVLTIVYAATAAPYAYRSGLYFQFTCGYDWCIVFFRNFPVFL